MSCGVPYPLNLSQTKGGFFNEMCMYRSYLLKNGFWAKKKSNNQIYMQHDQNIGGIYAIIEKEGLKKRVKIIVSRKEYFFDNFDELDLFLAQLHTSQTDFMKILKRKLISKRLRQIPL